MDEAEYNRLQILELRAHPRLHHASIILPTEREDQPLWKYCKHMSIPESLAYRMRLFQSSGRVAFHDSELFVESTGCPC